MFSSSNLARLSTILIGEGGIRPTLRLGKAEDPMLSRGAGGTNSSSPTLYAKSNSLPPTAVKIGKNPYSWLTGGLPRLTATTKDEPRVSEIFSRGSSRVPRQ